MSVKYQVADYREELERLALEGTPTTRFIARSKPSAQWFQKHVQPVAQVALCSCFRYFNPQETGTLTMCGRH
jgi:hypothetical protein